MLPSAKRPGDDAFDAPTATKYARTSGNGELTGSVRKKSGVQSRTGQACDRCKVRKIRCDARPGGCSPCLQNNTECRTTDRITGRATSRGYTENLENENTNLKMYLLELQAQLRQHGVEPGPAPQPLPSYTHTQNIYSPVGGGYDQSNQAERHSSMGPLLPEFRSGCIGDNYLGVLSENDSLSPIEGTSLHLFGTKVDIAEFMPAESPDVSAMSYQTFLKHAFGGSRPNKAPDLPSYEECKVFAEWYFRSVQNFIPILHKPDFMNLLYQIYHQHYQTNAAETVMVHMMLAVMNFQWASRNGNLDARAISFKHYHYALTFIPQLITSHKIEDVQALTLICSQLRNQPRPGASWMFTNMVFGIAIESGLHRSATSWHSTSVSEQDSHMVEMRKRVFWSLLTFHVCLSGKLGRPMPIRFEDFDIEMPNAVDDSLPGEANVTKWRKCSFRAAIQGFKLLKIVMQGYITIYSIRSAPAAYEVNVRQLEEDLLAFQRQIPPELSGGPQTTEEDRMCALYLQLAIAECELLLHHPSLCRSSSARVMSNNLEVCLAASSKFLNAAVQLKQLKSLDTTWYYATDFLAAIFTTLFAFTTEKKDQVSSSDLARLRVDMNSWLDVLGEVGNLLGSGSRLQEAVGHVIDHSLATISRHLSAKTASAAINASSASPSAAGQEHQAMYETNDYYSANNRSNANGDQPRHYSIENQHADPAPQEFTSGAQYTFVEVPHATTMAGQTYGGIPAGYGGQGYNAATLKSTIEGQLNTDLGRQAQQVTQQQQTPTSANTHFMAAFQPSPVQQNGFMGMNTNVEMAGPAAWRHFADNMVTMAGHVPATADLVQQHSQQYANAALMSLQGKTENCVDHAAVPQGNFGGMQMPVDGTQTWPLIHYQGKGAQ